jgi:hypothetical protein
MPNLRLAQKEIYYPFPNKDGFLLEYKLYWPEKGELSKEECFVPFLNKKFETRAEAVLTIDTLFKEKVVRNLSGLTIAYKGETRDKIPWQW